MTKSVDKPTLSEFTTRKDIKIAHLRVPWTNEFAIQPMFRAAFNVENKNTEGLTHLMEHMIGKTTVNYPKPKEHKILLEKDAIYRNAYTWRHFVGTTLQGADDFLEKGMKSAAEELINTTMNEHQLEVEKRAVIQEIKNKDTPEERLGRIKDYELFGTDYSYRPVGNIDIVEKLTLQQVQDLFNRVICKNNMALLVGSNRKNKELERLIDKHFGKLKAGKQIKLRNAKTRTKKPHKTKFVEQRDKNTVKIHMIMPIPIKLNKKDLYEVVLLRNFLNRSDTLIKRLRDEEKLVYSCNAATRLREDPQFCEIVTECEAHNVEKVISHTKMEVDATLGKLTDEAIEKEKRYIAIKSKFDSKMIDDLKDVRKDLVVLDSLKNPFEIYKNWEKIKPEGVRRAYKKYINTDNVYIAKLVPMKSKAKLHAKIRPPAT